MSQPPSYPGSGDNPENPGEYPPPPTHQSYGSGSNYDQPSYQPSGYEQPAPWQPQQPGPYQNWQGGNDASRPTDGVSIAAFVLSLTCCLSLIGLILGFVGLRRTKNDQRKGRWAAVTAIPVGIIGTLILAGGVIAMVWFVGNTVTPSNAEVGQCVNIDESEDGDEEFVYMTKADCDDGHDAEIMYVGTIGEAKEAAGNLNRIPNLDSSDVEASLCTAVVAEDLVAKVDDTMRWNVASEDTTDPKDNVKFLCYVERNDGKKLTESIG